MTAPCYKHCFISYTTRWAHEWRSKTWKDYFCTSPPCLTWSVYVLVITSKMTLCDASDGVIIYCATDNVTRKLWGECAKMISNTLNIDFIHQCGKSWCDTMRRTFMTLSWHENAIHMSGPLWSEAIDYPWILLTKNHQCRSYVFSVLLSSTSCWINRPGPRLNIKTVLSTYGDFHVKDKTAVRTSYL